MEEYSSMGGSGGGSGKAASSSASSTSGNNFGGLDGGNFPLIVALGIAAFTVVGLIVIILVAKKQ